MPALILLIPVIALFVMTACSPQAPKPAPTTPDNPTTLMDEKKPVYVCLHGFVYANYWHGHGDVMVPIFDKADRLPKRCDG